MENKGSLGIKLFISFIVLLAAVVAGLCAGSQWISPIKLISELSSGGISPDGRIVLYIRLPRVFAALLAGSALAVSGAVIQAVLGNPLAAPNIIGVNSGAGLFTVLCAALFPAAARLISAAAFLGALFAVLTVYGIARKTGASRMTIVLTGVGISSLLNAAIDTVTTLFPDALAGIASFKAGGVSGVSISALFPAWIFILVGIAGALKININFDAELAEKYEVMSVPTLIFFRNGEEISRLGGAVKKSEIVSEIDKL